MARKIVIDGRITVTGKRGHTNMGNPLDLSDVIDDIITTNPSTSGNPYTFENGLYATTTPGVGTNVKLGGLLVEDTKIDGDSNYSMEFEKLKSFNVNCEDSYIESNGSTLLSSVSTSTSEKCSIDIKNNAFVFSSTNPSNITNTYELPSQEKPNKGDVMVMNSVNKAIFTPYERDVYTDPEAGFGTGAISYFTIPFATDSWTCKRVTLLVPTNVNLGDSVTIQVRDSSGSVISNVVSLVINDVSGTAGFAFNNGLTFAHTGNPGLYSIECTNSSITNITFSAAKFIFSFAMDI